MMTFADRDASFGRRHRHIKRVPRAPSALQGPKAGLSIRRAGTAAKVAATDASLIGSPVRVAGKGDVAMVTVEARNGMTSVGRAPARLAELAEIRLRASGLAAVSALTCEERDGVICLRGTLPSYQ